MCNTYREIVSEVTDSEKFPLTELICFIGCGSLEAFSEHLKRNKCTDYNIDRIDQIIGSCSVCIKEKEFRDYFRANFSSFAIDEVEEHKEKIRKVNAEFRGICESLGELSICK